MTKLCLHIIFYSYIIQETEYKICIHIYHILQKFVSKTDESRRKTTVQTIIFARIRVIFIAFILGALKRQRADGNGKRNLGLKFAEPSLVTSRATSPF